jgi:hypothetical protein
LNTEGLAGNFLHGRGNTHGFNGTDSNMTIRTGRRNDNSTLDDHFIHMKLNKYTNNVIVGIPNI